MSNASRIVAVRAAVVAGLAPVVNGTSGMSKVSVTYQYKAEERRERIWTSNARFSHEAAALRAGRNARQETGKFDIQVLVEGVGRDAVWTAQRALDIGAVVEGWLSDRKSGTGLAVSGLQTLVVDGDGTMKEMFNENGTLAELTYPVRYTARLI